MGGPGLSVTSSTMNGSTTPSKIAEEDDQKFLICGGDSYLVLHEKDPAAVAGSLWFRRPNTLVSQTCSGHVSFVVQRVAEGFRPLTQIPLAEPTFEIDPLTIQMEVIPNGFDCSPV